MKNYGAILLIIYVAINSFYIGFITTVALKLLPSEKTIVTTNKDFDDDFKLPYPHYYDDMKIEEHYM